MLLPTFFGPFFAELLTMSSFEVDRIIISGGGESSVSSCALRRHARVQILVLRPCAHGCVRACANMCERARVRWRVIPGEPHRLRGWNGVQIPYCMHTA